MDELSNLTPQFIEIVLQYIYNIYQREFEEKKNLLQTEEERENLKTSEVFDENDNKLIEELNDFIDQYQQSKLILVQMQQQASEIEEGEQLTESQMQLNQVKQIIQNEANVPGQNQGLYQQI